MPTNPCIQPTPIRVTNNMHSLHQGDDHVAATANSDTKTGDSPSTQKRKAPSPHPSEMTTSQSPKRTKRDDHDYGGSSRRGSTATTRSPTAPRQISPVERRASASMEEKKRGKRLFGGLLNTLSQTTTNSQQQRRQEIERRQQEKATHQRAEDSKHREVKLARIREVRQREQIKFEEQVVSFRFVNDSTFPREASYRHRLSTGRGSYDAC